MPEDAPEGPALPLLIVGGGGHARVLIDALTLGGHTLLGLTDPDPALRGNDVLGVPVLGDDAHILEFAPHKVRLVNALGSTQSTAARRAVFERWEAKGYTFARVTHSSAIVAASARLGEGVQLLARSVVGAGASLGPNSLLNTGAIAEHDCRIGAHVHLAPGVTLSGGVTLGDGCHLGTGCVVIQNVSIGAGCVVGAGAVVTRDLEPYTLAVGVPARAVRKLA